MAIVSKKLVREIAKENNRRVSPAFITALETHVEELIKKACRVHNGGRTTLDAEVATWVGIIKD